MNAPQLHEAADLLYREAACLDERRWDDWIALFTGDCEFWIPAWKNEDELTTDPSREISLVYHAGRTRLEERVSRVRSGQSAASTPLPRTVHCLSNVQVTGEAVHANWQCHSYRFNETETLYGRYEYALTAVDGQWRIRRKKIVLVNDVINTVLDFYSV
jgi:3-phenylpropionate/cinnamic acid dioxygenase small subunit